MNHLNMSTSVVHSESSQGSSRNALQDLYMKSRSSSEGPLAILWDIENCPVPNSVRPEDVATNIRMALHGHSGNMGVVKMFSAYGDFNTFPRRLREGCQRTGVKLIDVPNGRKDAADKAILIDMFLFALDSPPPSTIMLISGDVDFAPALHVLGQRGYTVILVIPSGVGVSSALRNAGSFVWDWPSLANGEGFVFPRGSMPPRGLLSDRSGYHLGCQIKNNPYGHNEEEAILYKGVSHQDTKDLSMVSESCSNNNIYSDIPSTLRSQSLPCGVSEVPGGPSTVCENDEYDTGVQPGDVNGLKGQLVKLLEISGGCLPLKRIPTEYQKIFRRTLYVADYGAHKLVNLFQRMGEPVAISGKGQRRLVYLQNWTAPPSAPPLLLSRNDRKGKDSREDSPPAATGNGSSGDLSEEERVVIVEHDNKSQENINSVTMGHPVDHIMRQFKYELQEILVSYSCRISLGCFEEIYQRRYKKPLDYEKLGVNKLEDLFAKVGDVIVQEEPESRMKFVYAVFN